MFISLDDEQNAIDGYRLCWKEIFRPGCYYWQLYFCWKATNELDEIEIDILFLDVEMPKWMDWKLNQFPNRKFQVIFTTAHDHYAISAIKSLMP